MRLHLPSHYRRLESRGCRQRQSRASESQGVRIVLGAEGNDRRCSKSGQVTEGRKQLAFGTCPSAYPLLIKGETTVRNRPSKSTNLAVFASPIRSRRYSRNNCQASKYPRTFAPPLRGVSRTEALAFPRRRKWQDAPQIPAPGKPRGNPALRPYMPFELIPRNGK